jgi:hypothetical protein
MGATEEEYSFGMHEGRVLVERLANTYPTLMQTVIESAQNAIDAHAVRVFIGIDLKSAQVVVLDDGNGITPNFFRRALMSVGQGIKDEEDSPTYQNESLGRFGLGMVAPVNKCRCYRLVSRPKGSHLIRQWQFEAEKLRPKKKIGAIPSKLLPSFPKVPSAFQEVATASGVDWRTMALYIDVTRDRTISSVDLDELVGQVRSKLGRGMRRKQTVVHVMLRDEAGKVTQREIDPLVYAGEPLEVVTIEENLCGKVEFRLFRAPKSDSPGVNVLRMGDNSAISFTDFWRQANGSGWLRDDETLKAAFVALKSGFFEGDILIENAELEADRKSFKMSDVLRASYIAILLWFDSYGNKEYQSEKRARNNARWVNLGEKSLARLYDLFGSTPSFASIAPELTSMSAPQKEPAKEKEGAGSPGSRGRRVTAHHPSDKPKEGPSAPKPFDPRRRSEPPERTPTRLKFAYETLPESMRLFEVDHETGTIVFNVRHPKWAACDEAEGKRTSKHDRQVMRLQEWVAMKTLRFLRIHPSPAEFEAARWEIDEEVPLFVDGFILA